MSPGGSTVEGSVESTVECTATRAEVEAFYADQFALLDGGHVDAWVATFADGATFETPTLSARGHAEIARLTRQGVEARARAGVVHRHLFTALTLQEGGDGVGTTARTYVLVVGSDGAATTIVVSSVCTDRMVRLDGRLLVAARVVQVDGR